MKVSDQLGLLDVEQPECPEQHNLPLVTDQNGGAVLVHSPGHLYSPLAVGLGVGNKTVSGGLNRDETAFVAQLVRHLSPGLSAEAALRIPAAIEKDGKQYYILRNRDRAPSAWRLRLDHNDWFYPDFILWIVDRSTDIEQQTLCLIDPKGLHQGLDDGWSNHKFLCLSYVLRMIEARCKSTVLDKHSGKQVQFRLRGALVSSTDYDSLKALGGSKFDVANSTGGSVFPSRSMFERVRVFFPDGDGDYISRLVAGLEQESEFDAAMSDAVRGAEDFERGKHPRSEIGAFMAWQLGECGDLQRVLGGLVSQLLGVDGSGHQHGTLQGYCRRYLSDQAEHKRIGGGVEDMHKVVDPCQELNRRYMAKRVEAPDSRAGDVPLDPGGSEREM